MNSKENIGDIFELCVSKCNFKTLSTLVYMIFKYFDFIWRDIDKFMSNMGAMRCITANKWAKIFINGDFDMLMKDECGGKRSDAFFDTYPEIGINAKLFVVDGGAQR
ncbi:unnamed protein product [Rotaria magnacalcarata]|uniref:Uncharacterized protein n=2 Tax=Rotaria TaxID=231623 RepID=A0A816VT56_9BILA|nr:unnamed protein product [Rotaria magnacalcarata]CAF3762231.1 unnamed protein product [Rotaria socialis]CAF2128540.1 unnamed protein product [Rotaria magnacalcarata]CAF3994285.1 unnamed protein product [Rotaria magnacalcarata]CAF4333626.1 unnamed protein product [Rotaria magnacalcarata]